MIRRDGTWVLANRPRGTIKALPWVLLRLPFDGIAALSRCIETWADIQADRLLSHEHAARYRVVRWDGE